MSSVPLPHYGTSQGYHAVPYPPPPPYTLPPHPHYVPLQPPYNPQHGQPVYAQPYYGQNQNEGYHNREPNRNKSEVS